MAGAKRIGLPAILGLNSAQVVLADLEEKLGCPIFEIPGIPPSIPGIRLHNLLLNQISIRGGVVNDGMQAIDHEADNHQLKVIYSEAASRLKPHRSNSFVLATGEFLGGGLRLNQTGEIHETVLDLPISQNVDRKDWFFDENLNQKGHPIFKSGVRVNEELRPIDDAGNIIFNNLYAIGSILGNCDPVNELSLTGIALTTGYKLGNILSRI
jgi:glycerol-3-phosphate dehydrogenase subunit B